MSIWHLIAILSVALAALAQMALKKGASKHYDNVIREYLNIWVAGGYAIMFAVLMLDVYCISKGVKVKEISSIESFSYLFVPALSFCFFGERITLRKAGAIALIITGTIVFFLQA